MDTTSPRSLPTDPPPPDGPLSAGGIQRLWRDARYLLSAFPLALLSFFLAMVMIAGSSVIITAPIFIGLGGIGMRALATAQRRLLTTQLGLDVPEPVYAADLPSTGSTAGDVWRRTADPQTWLEMAWGLVGFFISICTFVCTICFAGAALAGLTSPLWFAFLHRQPGYSGLSELWLGRSSFWVDLVLQVLAGLLSLVVFLVTTRFGAQLQGAIAAALLGRRASAERYAALQEAHTAWQQAEWDSMRRLERDLHDGPQQTLVRVQLDIARADRLVATEPEKARSILADAGRTASDALGELRGLSRGIAPPVLAERGLGPAVRSLAGAHPAPVTVRDELPGRPGPQVESALYYAVSEALTNVAKHAGAHAVEVVLRQDGGMFEAVVTDDGVGGAAAAKGHGLAGLERRLAGVHGTLEVHSPTGGPTRIVARVPGHSAAEGS